MIPSPIEGGSGNREFLMHATLAPSDGMPDCAPTAPRDWADEVDAALAGTNVSPPPA